MTVVPAVPLVSLVNQTPIPQRWVYILISPALPALRNRGPVYETMPLVSLVSVVTPVRCCGDSGACGASGTPGVFCWFL